MCLRNRRCLPPLSHLQIVAASPRFRRLQPSFVRSVFCSYRALYNSVVALPMALRIWATKVESHHCAHTSAVGPHSGMKLTRLPSCVVPRRAPSHLFLPPSSESTFQVRPKATCIAYDCQLHTVVPRLAAAAQQHLNTESAQSVTSGHLG